MADARDTMLNRGWTQSSNASESVRRDTDRDAELTWAIAGSTSPQSVLLENSQRQTIPWDGDGDQIGASDK